MSENVKGPLLHVATSFSFPYLRFPFSQNVCVFFSSFCLFSFVCFFCLCMCISTEFEDSNCEICVDGALIIHV